MTNHTTYHCEVEPDGKSVCAPATGAACSRIVGYKLEDGTDKAELYFLPGRPAQKTLDQMAELIKSGWMVTGTIYSENAQAMASADEKTPPKETTL